MEILSATMEKFLKKLGSLDIKEWFYSLPVQIDASFLREELDAMSLPSSMNKIQSVAIGDNSGEIYTINIWGGG